MASPAQSRISKGERRRIGILDVAEKLFLSKGFSDVTLHMIIREAGGSRRMIYEHFGDKNGLFEVVCERILRRVQREFDGIQDTESAPREALTQLGINVLQILTSNPTLQLFELSLSESRKFPAIGQMFYEAAPDNAYAVLADYLNRQIAVGRLKDMDTAQTSRQFLGMIREDVHLRCILQPGYKPDDATIKRVVTGAVDTFLLAYAAENHV